jgi:hypothetical protein
MPTSLIRCVVLRLGDVVLTNIVEVDSCWSNHHWESESRQYGEIARRSSSVRQAYPTKAINSYLEDLEVSPVRTLGKLTEYNKQNADRELPPRQ